MLNVTCSYIYWVCGYARGQAMPVDSGHGHSLLPVTDNGHGHTILVAGAGVRGHYPHGFCPLPSLDTNELATVNAAVGKL